MVKIPRRAGSPEGANYLRELLSAQVSEQLAAFARSQQYVVHKPINGTGQLHRLHRHGREGQMVLVEVGTVKVTGGSFSLRIWVNGREVKRDSQLEAMVRSALDSEHQDDGEA